MAKISGLGWTTLNVDDSAGTPRDLRAPTNSFSFSLPQAMQDVTGVDKFAYERLALIADFSATLNGTFDPAANSAHDVFADLNTGVSRTVSFVHSSQSLTNECLGTDYSLNRGADGAFTWTVPFVLSNGTLPAWS